MDRLWTGYWVGGVSMALALIIPTMIQGKDGLTLFVGAAIWAALTPLGILIAKRTS